MKKMKEKAVEYHSKYGMNILPIRGKRPLGKWEKWTKDKQSLEDIKSIEWDSTTGLGCIQGINDIRVLDFDGVEDYEVIDRFLNDLGLSDFYTWVIQTGSGEGFHIYITVEKDDDAEKLLAKLDGEKAVYKFKLKTDDECKHVELRWKNCQSVLPPSLHESGGVYNFYYNEPSEMPQKISLRKVIECIENNCIIEDAERPFNETKLPIDNDRLESALDYLSKHLPEGCYDEWYLIGFGLVPLGKHGSNYFVKMSLDNPHYKDSEDSIRNKFSKLTEDYDGRVTIGTIYHLAEKYGWQRPIVRFWFKDDNNRIKISRTRFKRLLESEGYCKLKIDSNYLFVKVDNNIVEEVNPIHFKEFVMNYLLKAPVEEFEDVSRPEIIEAIIKASNQLFNEQFFEFLITRPIEFNRDTAQKSYIYYMNCFVEVTKDRFVKKDYKELSKAIWKKQIIGRDFEHNDMRGDYEDFLFNVCNKKRDRYEALKSGIGFLLHQYKDPNVAKAIVFIDEKLSEGAFGRSGKGLVIKAIGHIRNLVVEDGRNFSPSKNFAFQRVKIDTDMLAIEDIRENFPFERLFSVITDGIVVERKNKDEIFITFRDSPKLVLSSNYTIQGVDDSTMDRQFIVEFSDYYNKYHRPFDDFGKLFFEGWSKTEWNIFDNFMLECLKYYLEKGLVEYEHVNLEAKKLIDETCAEFAEFTEELELGELYDKKDLFKKFKDEYEEHEKLNQGTFTRWLKIWSRIRGHEFAESKSGTRRSITFRGMRKAV